MRYDLHVDEQLEVVTPHGTIVIEVGQTELTVVGPPAKQYGIRTVPLQPATEPRRITFFPSDRS